MLKPWPGTDILCIESTTVPGNPPQTIDTPTFKCAEAIFSRILIVVPAIVALALFVTIVIGGFKYLTSGGDQKAAASAKQTITYAAIGLFLITMAYVIFKLIQTFTGVNVTNFTVTPDATPSP